MGGWLYWTVSPDITKFGSTQKTKRRIVLSLRNAGPTFCKMMKVTLKDQVGRNVLSYIDDIVVASKKENYISDLAKTFMNMHEARLRLNPEKCVQNHKGKSPRMSNINEGHRGKS
jgi:hypothetical protein